MPIQSAIVYTDIARDGMMQGVNVEATMSLAKQTSIPIIASGGITNIEDISGLLSEAHHGIMGAITGRAIYEDPPHANLSFAPNLPLPPSHHWHPNPQSPDQETHDTTATQTQDVSLPFQFLGIIK
jgi:tRNA-dihydrouridine synthase